jgi:hypothetical protein
LNRENRRAHREGQGQILREGSLWRFFFLSLDHEMPTRGMFVLVIPIGHLKLNWEIK